MRKKDFPMEKMTISQCLRRIAAVKGELKEYQNRAYSAVDHKAEDEPAYKFEEMVAAMNASTSELIGLHTRLLITNAATFISHGGETISLTEAALRLKELKSQISWFSTLPSRDQKKYTTRENEWDDDLSKSKTVKVEHLCHFTTPERDKVVKGLRGQFAVLNDVVERTNQNTNLLSSQAQIDRPTAV